MRKLILEDWMSLDGFASDKNDKLDFFQSVAAAGQDKDQAEFLKNIDTILLGRKTYDMFKEYWPKPESSTELVSGPINSLPKIVFSKTLDQAPWGKYPAATVAAEDPAQYVNELKSQQGKDIILWGSISIGHQLIAAGLVDNIRIHICPVAIGAGKKIFPDTGSYLNYELTGSKRYDNGVMSLFYSKKR